MIGRLNFEVNTVASRTIEGTFRQTNLPNEPPEYLAKREELRPAEIDLMHYIQRRFGPTRVRAAGTGCAF